MLHRYSIPGLKLLISQCPLYLQSHFFGLPDPEDEGTAVFWNVRDYLFSDTVSHPRRLESPETVF